MKAPFGSLSVTRALTLGVLRGPNLAQMWWFFGRVGFQASEVSDVILIFFFQA